MNLLWYSYPQPPQILVWSNFLDPTWCKPAAAYIWIPVTSPASIFAHIVYAAARLTLSKMYIWSWHFLFVNLYSVLDKARPWCNFYLPLSFNSVCICDSSLMFLLKHLAPQNSSQFTLLRFYSLRLPLFSLRNMPVLPVSVLFSLWASVLWLWQTQSLFSYQFKPAPLKKQITHLHPNFDLLPSWTFPSGHLQSTYI